MRKELPLLLTTVFGLIVVFSKWFYLGEVWGLHDIAESWVLISQGFAVAIGAASLTRIHGRNIQRRREDWPYSLVLLVCMYFYIILTLYQTVEGTEARWIYDAYITPVGSALFGTIAFYITSAAYRVFRVRTREATVLMIFAVVTMLGMAPIGDVMISGWGDLARWLQDVPVGAVTRGILIAGYIGALATGMRIVLGLERAHLGGFTGG